MSHRDDGENRVWWSKPGPWRPADLLAVAGWSAAILAFFWTLVTFRGALFYFDITEINYPYRDFLAREMRLGRFSRWFPGLYCGMPLYSESQAGYLHPLKYVLYPWMATWKALNLDTVISVWLTGLGTYGWLRRHVGPVGALTGGAVFGLSGFVWAHLIHTSMNNALTSVPFAVWALEWAWERRRLTGVVLGGLALACQVFAGHLQDTLLTAGLLAVYGAYRSATEADWNSRWLILFKTAALIGLGVGLAAVQWVPSKELLDRSPRAGGLSWDDLTYGSWHPELLPTLVVREAYGTRARDTDWMDGFYPYHEMNAYLGLTAMALAVVGAAAFRDRWVAFWVMLTALGAILMLGRYTFLMDFANRIPVIGSSRIPVRFHLWVSLGIAALAAVGDDRLGQGGEVSLKSAWLFVAGLVAVSVPILLHVYTPVLTRHERWNLPYHVDRYRWLNQELLVSSVRTLAVTAVGLTAMRLAARSVCGKAKTAACATIPLVVIADLLGAHWYDVPSVDPSYWTNPPLSAKVIKSDPSFTRVFGIAERSAGEPGYASEPIDFTSIRDTLDWSLPPVWGLPSSSGVTPIIPRRMVEYTDHARAGAGRFEIESVSHVVTGLRASTIFGNGRQVGSARVHRIARAQPRARLLGHPYYAESESDAIAAIDRLGPKVRERVVVEDPDRPLAEDCEVSGSARIVIDDPEHVEVEVDAATAAYLVLADSFDPGWSATLDGQTVLIRPAWLAFRAVFVTKGSHRIVFRYRPAGFIPGLTLSGLTLGLCICALILPLRLAPIVPEHAAVAWPVRRRKWLLGAVGVLVFVSVFGINQRGRPGIRSRWFDSFHQFTWGAGIEAMRPKPAR